MTTSPVTIGGDATANVIISGSGNVVYAGARDMPRWPQFSCFRAVGSRLGEANALQSRADVLDAQGQTEQASAGYEQAMKLYQAIGDEYSVARALYYLGRLHLRYNDTPQARVAFERSIAIFSAHSLPDIAAIVQKELNALS